MDFNGATLEHLSREQCLLLVGQVPVGRIVYTRQALPAVELRDHFIRISPTLVNGRRLAAERLAGDGDAS